MTGFGEERVEDVAEDARRRETEGARRREEGTRGRMRDMRGEELDRSAGGPFQARRR